mmetsp:Transcript_12387/g.16260  ORF Transcript_12387/g.16260 Transcript_12387/m.16260 type:complete len:222 (+) Transcript_12387:145-810(+)
MVSESEITDLLTNESYNPHSVPQLEEHLMAQVRGEAPYMADSVRRLVKLYQLFPETSQPENIGRACLMAALEYPNTDHLALGYMVPPTIAATEPCATIQKCSSLLEACQFAQFWETYETLKSSNDAELSALATRSVPGVQKSILSALALSYKQAPTKTVCEALKVDKVDAVVALKYTEVVQSADANVVTFVPTVDNTKRERVYQENMDFASISTLMAKIAQ